MTPDEVIDAFGEKATGLKVTLLDNEEGGLVVVEGRAADLRFLGQLLLAIAHGGDSGFHIDPRGAGSAHFDSDSPLGLYIQRRDDAQGGIPK